MADRHFLRITSALVLGFLCLALVSSANSIYGQNSTDCSSGDSLAVVNAEWNWTDLGRGARAGQANVRIFNSNQCISVACVPASRFKTRFAGYMGAACTTTDSTGRREGAVVALNGSYFNVRELVPTTLYALGHRIGWRTSPEELFRVDGVIALRKGNGRKADIMPCDTAEYDSLCKKYHSVMASGPVLLQNGESKAFVEEEGFTLRRHPRTVFGKDSKGNYWFIVIDGRFPGKAEGMTIPETAALARYLGLSEAINLDGGGSSTLWTAKTGVLNHPCDNRRFDHGGSRRVPNAIIAK
jgi:exopolysaccharide biosynthesis protein